MAPPHYYLNNNNFTLLYTISFFLPFIYLYQISTKKKYTNYYEQLWTPHFGSCVSHSMGELDFDLKNWFNWLKRNDLESPLIFVLFLKGKQNKKEKP